MSIRTPIIPFTLVAACLLSCNAPKEVSPTPAQPSMASAPASTDPSQPSSALAVASATSIALKTPPAASSARIDPPPEPLPDVAVKNIGMHIGGGPNDRATKAPIKESVQPHFDSFRACWKLVADKEKQGDFGADLLIPRDGGKAEVSHPRTSIRGERFGSCVVEVFESIHFKKPKTGKTMVSYSLRFTPAK